MLIVIPLYSWNSSCSPAMIAMHWIRSCQLGLISSLQLRHFEIMTSSPLRWLWSDGQESWWPHESFKMEKLRWAAEVLVIDSGSIFFSSFLATNILIAALSTGNIRQSIQLMDWFIRHGWGLKQPFLEVTVVTVPENYLLQSEREVPGKVWLLLFFIVGSSMP